MRGRQEAAKQRQQHQGLVRWPRRRPVKDVHASGGGTAANKDNEVWNTSEEAGEPKPVEDVHASGGGDVASKDNEVQNMSEEAGEPCSNSSNDRTAATTAPRHLLAASEQADNTRRRRQLWFSCRSVKTMYNLIRHIHNCLPCTENPTETKAGRRATIKYISPYNTQVVWVTKRVAELTKKEVCHDFITTSNKEDVQGAEADIVICDLVRTKKVGFTGQWDVGAVFTTRGRITTLILGSSMAWDDHVQKTKMGWLGKAYPYLEERQAIVPIPDPVTMHACPKCLFFHAGTCPRLPVCTYCKGSHNVRDCRTVPDLTAEVKAGTELPEKFLGSENVSAASKLVSSSTDAELETKEQKLAVMTSIEYLNLRARTKKAKGEAKFVIDNVEDLP
ncbi:hypothetical protein F4780DRAFT_785442 [Xylariomycetidae sp. FL0641]|nr:hypothetical protein F4780DRAFT_785442 [Xylariomycetidae sp. FL0641]